MSSPEAAVSGSPPEIRSGVSAIEWRRWASRFGFGYLILWFGGRAVRLLVTVPDPLALRINALAWLLLLATVASIAMRVRAGRLERRLGYVSDPLVVFGANDAWRYWVINTKTGEVLRPPKEPSIWERIESRVQDKDE